MENMDYVDVLLMGYSRIVFPKNISQIGQNSLKFNKKWRFDENLIKALDDNAKIISGTNFFYDEYLKSQNDLICHIVPETGYKKYVLGNNFDKIESMKKYVYLTDDNSIAALIKVQMNTANPWTIYMDNYNEKLVILNPEKAYFNNFYIL